MDVKAPATAWQVRVILAVVGFVAIWPLLHRGIVAAYDVNPWKLGGFAMYTTPTPPVLAVAFEPRGDDGVPIRNENLPLVAQLAHRDFEGRRWVLGELHRPDGFAREVLRARPELGEVIVLVQRMVLDPSSARMESRTVHYTYDRNGLVAEKRIPAR